MKEKIDILIVEDREENRRAAQKYFDMRNDVHADFATNYDEGMRKLQGSLYGLGIFDLELPRSEGAEPEKLGFELAKEATKYAMPWAVITAGIDHHQCKAAFVSYSWEGIKDPNEKLGEITEISKTDGVYIDYPDDAPVFVGYIPSEQEMQSYLKEAGFEDIQTKKWETDKGFSKITFTAKKLQNKNFICSDKIPIKNKLFKKDFKANQ